MRATESVLRGRSAGRAAASRSSAVTDRASSTAWPTSSASTPRAGSPPRVPATSQVIEVPYTTEHYFYRAHH